MFTVPSELGTGVIKNLSLAIHLICVPFIGVPFIGRAKCRSKVEH